MSSWADTARARINHVNDTLPEGATLAERIKAVDAAYPFGERSYWPHKAWLKARRAYLTRYGYVPRGHKLASETGPLFAGWARDPATGRPVIP